MCQRWPTVDELIAFRYHTLEEAHQAIAALSPNDPNRKLFLAGDWEGHQIWLRAADADRAKLIAGAVRADYEEVLLEIRADASEEYLALFETAREGYEEGCDNACPICTELLEPLCALLTIDHSADAGPALDEAEFPSIRASIDELRKDLSAWNHFSESYPFRGTEDEQTAFADGLSRDEACRIQRVLNAVIADHERRERERADFLGTLAARQKAAAAAV